MTGADLPNAFPYFIAIERMVFAHLDIVTASLVLVAYSVVYCLPCLVLLALGLSHGDRVTAWLRRLHRRFGSQGTIPPSRTRAALLFVASVVAGAIALTA
jgi:hypothetical protein